jgi:hypothetical protein
MTKRSTESIDTDLSQRRAFLRMMEEEHKGSMSQARYEEATAPHKVAIARLEYERATGEQPRPWLSGGKGSFATFKKQTHDEARAIGRELAVRSGKYRDVGPGMKQMDQGGYTSPGDIRKYQKGKLPAKGAQPLQTGVRGGQYVVTASGEKHYVGNNEHHDAAQTRGKGPWQR